MTGYTNAIDLDYGTEIVLLYVLRMENGEILGTFDVEGPNAPKNPKCEIEEFARSTGYQGVVKVRRESTLVDRKTRALVSF